MKKNAAHDPYQEFLSSEPLLPPEKLNLSILNQIQKSLHFSRLAVLAKLSFVHMLTTLFVLYICPQFGVRIGSSTFSLMEFFMKFGHLPCAAFCGATLVGGTFLTTAFLLQPQESFWLRNQLSWISALLAVLTLIVLFSLGASAHHTELVFWCAFGIVGGWLTFEIGRKGRVYSARFLLRITT